VKSDQAVNSQHANWFGRTIARHFSLDPETGLGLTKIETIIRKLKRKGTITVENRRARGTDRHRYDFWAPVPKAGK
jgi:hypothetical protein